MTTIDIISKTSGKVVETTTSNTINLKENSVVEIHISYEEVANYTREGNSLIINLKNGEKITIESYFDDPINSHHIVFDDKDGGLYWAEFVDANEPIFITASAMPPMPGV